MKGVFQAQAELVTEPQRLHQIEPWCADPSAELTPLDQLEYDVWPTIDDLDGMGPDDVGVFT
jgi:hypothetical protein